MTAAPASQLVMLNAGSSSLKVACFSAGAQPGELMRAEIQDLGLPQAQWHRLGSPAIQPLSADREAATAYALAECAKHGAVVAVGHRIVHPGLTIRDHQPITEEVEAQLHQAVELDRSHLPAALAVLSRARTAFPGAQHIACLDTVFHRDMPVPAQLLGIPRAWRERGVRRLGFHGLSYTFLMQELERRDGPEAAAGRVVLAHLGSGASMAGVRDRCCLDTSMGFTASAGLLMATRPGDLDPGALAYMVRQDHLDSAQLDALLTERCGLRGVSGLSGRMQELLQRAGADPAAGDAVALFIHQARRWLGSLVIALGGLDTLVFSGGIGEHAPEIRAGIVAQLDFLGVAIDADANRRHAEVISTPASRVRVRILSTDEEAVMADITRRIAAPQRPVPSPPSGNPEHHQLNQPNQPQQSTPG